MKRTLESRAFISAILSMAISVSLPCVLRKRS
jgi:hypothetical protein